MVRLDERKYPEKSNSGGQLGKERTTKAKIDGVEYDLKKIGNKKWKMLTQDRRHWRHLLEKAKAHTEL